MARLKKVVVIDGQGGGIGKAVIEKIRAAGWSGFELVAVGTNALATAAMIRAGADAGATGESAVIWNCQDAAVIIGVLGILAAGSMYGELSSKMATAIASSSAQKILIPVGKCRLEIVGLCDEALPVRIDQATAALAKHLSLDE